MPPSSCCPVLAGAQTAKRPYALDDLAKFKTVSDPQVSPDGKWIAYTVGSVDVEKDKRDSDVWMVSWDGTQTLQLTSSKDSESRPRWSPDGKYLAFTTSRGDEDEKKKGSQVWLLNRSGGEAQKLTDVKGGVDDFEWSPDSTRLVLVVSDPDPSDDPEKIEGWKKKTKPPIVIDRYQFKRDYAGYLEHLRDHLYLFDIATKKAEPLTSGDYDDRSPSWSPDGRQIAFVSKRGPDPDRSHDSNVFVIDAKAGATPRQLTTYAGEDGGRPAWSPDGSTIAYLQSDEAKWYAYDQTKLALIPAAGGTAALAHRVARSRGRLTGMVGRRQEPVLHRGRRSRRVPRAHPRGRRQGRAADDGPPCRRVGVAGPQGRRRAAVVDGQLARTKCTWSKASALRKVTTHNDAWVGEVAFSSIEDVTFTAKDGTVVNGLLTRPASRACRKAAAGALDSRRPQRAGRPQLRQHPRDPCRQRLRRPAGELPRRLGARREVPEGHLRRLGQPRGRRSAGRGGLGDQERRGRSRSARASAAGATAASSPTTPSPPTRASRPRPPAPAARCR